MFSRFLPFVSHYLKVLTDNIPQVQEADNDFDRNQASLAGNDITYRFHNTDFLGLRLDFFLSLTVLKND